MDITAPTLPRLAPETPGFLTSSELQFYLQVGKNEVAAIARRFDIPKREGRFREADVWRQLLELAPASDDAVSLLRVQLQDINWVADRLGRAASTIRDRIRNGSFGYPCGVQLGGGRVRTPRLRRWLPGHFEAALTGRELTDLRRVPRRMEGAALARALAEHAETREGTGCGAAHPDPGAIFAAIAAGGATRSEPSPP